MGGVQRLRLERTTRPRNLSGKLSSVGPNDRGIQLVEAPMFGPTVCQPSQELAKLEVVEVERRRGEQGTLLLQPEEVIGLL
jgi:hypothetical protein